MAKLCCLFSVLCAYFIFFLRINTVYSNSDYHFYQTGSPYHRSENAVDFIELNNIGHSIQRRDVVPLPPPSKTKTLPKNESGTDELVIPVNKTTLTQVNTTKIVLSQPKNLGVNGTGQRKYKITTTKPLLVATLDTKNKTKDNDDDIFDASDPQKFNTTLSEHNITAYKTDTHTYYNTTFIIHKDTAQHYWVNLENRTDVKTNELLSTSHRRAATIKLSFDFPFYGHMIKSVTIATGGFIYTGEYVHSWLAATQYIAPLMANFDTSLSNDSYIKYVDNGTAFTVEWEKVGLQDSKKEGTFTFQATLHSNGDVVFVYKDVPVFIKEINDDHHPVKVGLSDAYIMDHTIYFVRRKTIYEYHRVNFSHKEIKNWTVIYLAALPTCLESKDCDSCLSNKAPKFTCSWCPTNQRCSTGTDRYRQSWIDKKCDYHQIKNISMCGQAVTNYPADQSDTMYKHKDNIIDHMNSENELPNSQSSTRISTPDKMGMSGIVAILFLVCVGSGLALWVLYAYRNPHTTSGQILIRYRPSQWHWRRGEARYTAATIHM